MPTALSWTDEWRGAFVDLRHLLWFRACTVRRRRPAAAAVAVLVAVTRRRQRPSRPGGRPGTRTCSDA